MMKEKVPINLGAVMGIRFTIRFHREVTQAPAWQGGQVCYITELWRQRVPLIGCQQTSIWQHGTRPLFGKSCFRIETFTPYR